jgi:hypothetical protein
VTRALTDAVWIFAAFLVLLVAAAITLATRRFLLERSGGTVECALRRPAAGGSWRLGLLSYQRDELFWYGALGVLLRPEQVFSRRALTVVSRRPAAAEETSALGADRIVVEVAVAGEQLELAMSDSALTGFLAWLEASPPGSHLEDFALAGVGWARASGSFGATGILIFGDFDLRHRRLTGRRRASTARPRFPRWRPGRG